MIASSAYRRKCAPCLKRGLQFGTTIAARGRVLNFRSMAISLVTLARPARSKNMEWGSSNAFR